MSSMSVSDEDYVCSLDDASLEVARKELNEDPKERLSAVKTFRDWILQQPHINCPTDIQFLLPFLRTAKFSQLRARQILTGNMTVKRESPEWHDNMDMTDPRVLAFLRSGYFILLPGYDLKGRRIFLGRPEALDLNSTEYDKETVLRTSFGVFKYMYSDEKTQVHGTQNVMDCTGFTMKHHTYYGLATMRKLTKQFQGNHAGRFKGFHYYNIGSVFESMMELVKPLLKKKFQDRLHFHSNMETLYHEIPMEMWPKEYLPDDYHGPCAGTIQDLVDNLIAEVTRPEVRQWIIEVSKSEYGIDKSKMPSDIPNESFRKLNVE